MVTCADEQKTRYLKTPQERLEHERVGAEYDEYVNTTFRYNANHLFHSFYCKSELETKDTARALKIDEQARIIFANRRERAEDVVSKDTEAKTPSRKKKKQAGT